MSVVRRYTGETRHYPFLKLADGTTGATLNAGDTVELATAEDVPDHFFREAGRAKKTTVKNDTPEPDPVPEPAGDIEPPAVDKGEQA